MSKPGVTGGADAQFNATKVKELLEKTKHYDADERFMATKDLIDQLKLVSGALDAALQQPIRDTILRLLDDKNSDVSTMAVKCLSQLAQKFSNEHITFIVDKLGEIIVDPTKTSSRDIVTDGLQTMISSIADEPGAKMAPKLIGQLLRGLTQKPNKDEVDMEMACLTIVKNLLDRFGNDVTDHHKDIVNALTGLLEHPNDSVRKRGSLTLGPLVIVLDDALFNGLMDVIIGKIETSKTPGTYIQSISAVCRSAGVKVGPYLPQIVPKLEKFCQTNSSAGGRKRKDDEEEDESQLELWETSLQALESITLRCPNKVTQYVPNIVKLATQLSTYDPMYTYESDDMDIDSGAAKSSGKKATKAAASNDWGDDGAGGDDDAWGDDGDADMNGGGDEEAGGWDDDEAAATAVANASSDNSWKVRRAAVGLLTAFIRARSDILKGYYNDICDHLVARFKERDSAVKEEILLCTRDLLKESVVTSKSGATTSGHAGATGVDADMEDVAPMTPSFIRTRSSYETLDVKLPQIVHGCEKLFAAVPSPDTRTTRAIFALLSELVRVRHGGLENYLAKLMPHILQCITHSRVTKESEAAADALKLLHSIVELHPFEALKPYLGEISSVLSAAVSNGLETNKAETLNVIAAVGKLIKGQGQKSVSQELYRVTYAEFLQKDIPLNIKLATIATLSSIISYNADTDLDGPAVSNQVVPVLLERLDNDSTVQPALRAITRMSNLSSSIDFGVIIGKSSEIITLCRKNSHHLRNDVVRTIESLLRRSNEKKLKGIKTVTFTEKQVEAILNEVSSLISDADLHLTHLVLDLCSTSLSIGSTAAFELISKLILPQTIKLVLSPRLQGVALSSLIKFFQACVSSQGAKTGTSPLSYNNLLGQLLAQANSTSSSKLSKSAYTAIAQCIAGTTEKASDSQATETVTRFVNEIVKRGELDDSCQIALLVLGEMGRKRDLTSHQGLEAACLKAFDSKDEFIRSSAAFALGNISVGNLEKNLPTLLGLINAKAGSSEKSGSNQGYLLFSALKEIISTYSIDASSMTGFRKYTDTIIPILFKHVDTPSEATRAMVAECLGRLIVIDPIKILTPMEKLIASPKADVRGCIITSIRFCLTPLMDYQILYQNISTYFVPLVKDVDLEVRRQTFLTINAIARVNIESIPRDTLYSVILPTLYFETKIKPELVKEVDYGAFKKIIDDGKPLRRSAYQTLQTLLEVTPHRIDLPEFIAAVKQGIHDEEDIQMLSYQIFIELAKYHGSALLEIIEQLPSLIMNSVKKYITEAKSKEPEQALEVLRSIVRALLVFNQIPGVELCSNYTHFYKQVCATSLMAQLIKEQTS